METQVEARLAEIQDVLQELHEHAEQDTMPHGIIEEAVYEQLGMIGNLRIGTSESDRDKVDLQLIAMEILAIIGVDTSGLKRAICRPDSDASFGQRRKARSIHRQAHRRH